jgi:predicted PurR-regulated permease PerM
MAEDNRAAGLSRLAIVFFIACFAGVLYFLYQVFRPYLTVLVWAVVLTVISFPMFKAILARVRRRRTLAAALTCILILLLIALPLTILGTLLTQQSIALYQSVQENAGSPAEVTAQLQKLQSHPVVQRLTQTAGKWLGAGDIDLEKLLREVTGTVSRFLIDIGPRIIKNVGEWIFDFFLIFITIFFLLRDGPQLMGVIKASNPLPDAIEAELYKKFQDVSFATFFGSLLTAVTQGMAACFLFWALGLPTPVFWGALVSLLSLVPIVGAFLVWLPWTAYLLLAGHTAQGLLLLGIGGLVVSSIDNVLKPIIIRGRTDMHPLLVFFSVLGGLRAFGFIGILLGPLMVALFITFLNFYQLEFQDTLRHKGQPDA